MATAAAAALVALALGCSDDAGCSYNGVCDGGTCACRPQWRGPHCASLHLLPTSVAAGLHGAHEPVIPADPSHPIGAQPLRGYWGSSVLRGDDGQWHMWSAEMINGCGIWAWCSNSQVVHAVASTPTGAYTRKGVAQKVWAHEPTVARAPTGEYVMFFTSSPWGPNGQPPVNATHFQPCDCTSLDSTKNCGWSDLTDGVPGVTPPPIGYLSRGMPTFMSFAKEPEGPWSEPMSIPIRGLGDANFAFTIRKDGSLWGVGREAMYLATDWKDNTTYTFYTNTTGVMGEDPYVWIDEVTKPGMTVYHMLRHCNTTEGTPSTHGQPFGTHAWSLDGGFTWASFGAEHAYPRWAAFTDAANQSFDMRERPHLIMDKDGVTPLALTNGAAPNAAWNRRGMTARCNFKTGSDCREYSYNLLAAINQKLDDEAAGRPSESRGSCSHPASAGCEPNHDCTAPHCAVIRSFNSTDADQCCAACEADVTCGAYTLNHGTGMCWLRTASSPRKAKGRCVSGAVPRAPAPPPAPLPPMPQQPPHIGIAFAAPDVVAEGTNAQSFYSLPCGTSYCVFGNGGATLWSPSKLWHNASAAAAGFAMPGAKTGTLETIGNLSNSAVDGDAFYGDGQSSLLRFDADGALQVSALESDGEVMTYTGLPCRAFKHRIGSGGTVRMDDGTLLQTVNFKCYNDSQSVVDRPLSVGHSTLGLYQSLDGKHWSYLSTVVSWHQTIGPDGRPEDEGPNENDFVRLPDGSLLVVVRADSGDGIPRRLLRPYFAVTSLDGKVWSEPKTMAATDGSLMGSARPRLLLLGKVKDGRRQGPLVLTGGRPGLYLWVNAAADGKAWEKINLAAAHNTAALASGPSQRFCSPFVNASLATSDRREGICQLSMSYNSLVRMGDCEAMVLYAMAARSFPGALAACSSDRATVFALRFTASIGAGCTGG